MAAQLHQCYMKKNNLDLLYNMNCSLNKLTQEVKYCTVPVEGSSDSPCHQQGDPEFSVDQMTTLLKGVEKKAKEALHDLQNHGGKRTPENTPVEVTNTPVQAVEDSEDVTVRTPNPI